jgi:hypothetical protein
MENLDLILPPDKVNGIKAFVEDMTLRVKTVEVHDAMSMANATDVGQKMKGAINKLEDMRKAAVGPLNEQVKEINSRFRYFTEPLLVAKEDLNAKMISFQRAEMAREQKAREDLERKQMEELEKIENERRIAAEKLRIEQVKLSQETLTKAQEAKAKAEIEKREKELAELKALEMQQEMAPAMVEPPKKTTRTANGSKATFRSTWKYEVEDESKVPREYLCVHSQAIREAIGQGVREIDGVRIYQDLSLSQ